MTSFRNKNRGFTLIEILVVISIMGLLASILSVALNGAKEKAKAGASISFDANLHQTLGADSFARADFNDGKINGTLLESKDASTVFAEGNVTASSDTPDGNGYSASIAGQNEFIGVYNLGGIVPMIGYTVSAWIKPSSSDVNYPNSTYYLFLSQCSITPACDYASYTASDRAIMVYVRYASGQSYVGYGDRYTSPHTPSGTGECQIDIPVNKWSHVTVSYTGETSHGGTNTLSLWVNGKPVDQSGSNCTLANQVVLGDPYRAYGDDSLPFDGYITDFVLGSSSVDQYNQYQASKFLSSIMKIDSVSIYTEPIR